MNRRALVAEGWRYLARVLPGMVAAAGSLGAFLPRPPGAASGPRVASFPDQAPATAPPTSTLLPQEDERWA